MATPQSLFQGKAFAVVGLSPAVSPDIAHLFISGLYHQKDYLDIEDPKRKNWRKDRTFEKSTGGKKTEV